VLLSGKIMVECAGLIGGQHLQANVQRIEGYVKALEDRLVETGK